jgi:hypothetical protein
MIFYFVTKGEDDQADTLNRAGVNDRMISYLSLRKKREGFLPDYVTRGHGRYINEDAETIKKMRDREFLTYFLSEYDLIEKEDI